MEGDQALRLPGDYSFREWVRFLAYTNEPNANRLSILHSLLIKIAELEGFQDEHEKYVDIDIIVEDELLHFKVSSKCSRCALTDPH